MSQSIFSSRSYPRLKNNYTMKKLQVADSPVFLFQNAETRALLVGALEFKEKTLRFRLGRQHFNGLRNMDLDMATHLLMLSSEFQKSISRFEHPKETVGALLMREPIAQNPFLNASLANINSRLYVLLDVHHVADSKGIKGKSGQLSYYRLDLPDNEQQQEKIRSEIHHALLCDSIAAGRNLITAIKELKERFKNLEKVTVVSVFATKEGVQRISQFCQKEMGRNCQFFVFQELLSVNPVNEYDCFYPQTSHDLRDEQLLKKILGKHVHRLCMGGDFTANIYGKAQAQAVFEEQVAALGFDPQKKLGSEITLKELKALGYSFDDLLPYSTLYVASEQGVSLEMLKKQFEKN